jgi:DNA-binding FrmR family transcriptional regulator
MSTMTKAHTHSSHPDIIRRLQRAGGHLQKVITMIEGGRPCLDLAQQLHAVEKAIAQAKKTLIQDHLDSCLDNVATPLARDQRRSIDEFKEITKYL